MIVKRIGLVDKEEFELVLKDFLSENRRIVLKYPVIYVYYSMGLIFFSVVLSNNEFDYLKLGEFKFVNGEAVFEGKNIYWRFPL